MIRILYLGTYDFIATTKEFAKRFFLYIESLIFSSRRDQCCSDHVCSILEINNTWRASIHSDVKIESRITSLRCCQQENLTDFLDHSNVYN